MLSRDQQILGLFEQLVLFEPGVVRWGAVGGWDDDGHVGLPGEQQLEPVLAGVLTDLEGHLRMATLQCARRGRDQGDHSGGDAGESQMTGLAVAAQLQVCPRPLPLRVQRVGVGEQFVRRRGEAHPTSIGLEQLDAARRIAHTHAPEVDHRGKSAAVDQQVSRHQIGMQPHIGLVPSWDS